MENLIIPVNTDDFKLIRGIGPSLEKRLHSAGILTFAQLGKMSPEEIAPMFTDLTGLSAERITRLDWIGQARALAGEQKPAEAETDASESMSHQHYAVFTIELMLNEENETRRTRVFYIQNQEEKTWAGWDPSRLIDFIASHAELHLPEAGAQKFETIAPLKAESIQDKLRPEQAQLKIGGELHLPLVKVISAGDNGRDKLLTHEKPFNASLTLDLTKVTSPRDIPLEYSATIYAKSLSDGTHRIAGIDRGTLTIADKKFVSLTVSNIVLPSGVHRLEALAILTMPSDKPRPDLQLMAMAEGGLIEIT
jgi:predicted flap endonuclease-1-like 5' DNA nuclease